MQWMRKSVLTSPPHIKYVFTLECLNFTFPWLASHCFLFHVLYTYFSLCYSDLGWNWNENSFPCTFPCPVFFGFSFHPSHSQSIFYCKKSLLKSRLRTCQLTYFTVSCVFGFYFCFGSLGCILTQNIFLCIKYFLTRHIATLQLTPSHFQVGLLNEYKIQSFTITLKTPIHIYILLYVTFAKKYNGKNNIRTKIQGNKQHFILKLQFLTIVLSKVCNIFCIHNIHTSFKQAFLFSHNTEKNQHQQRCIFLQVLLVVWEKI